MNLLRANQRLGALFDMSHVSTVWKQLEDDPTAHETREMLENLKEEEYEHVLTKGFIEYGHKTDQRKVFLESLQGRKNNSQLACKILRRELMRRKDEDVKDLVRCGGGKEWGSFCRFYNYTAEDEKSCKIRRMGPGYYRCRDGISRKRNVVARTN